MATPVTVVTGGAGFAGRHLLDRLSLRAPAVGWCRPGGHPPTDIPNVTWQGVDLLDGGAIARAVAEAQPTRIYHLAGAPNVATSWQNVVNHLRTNALGTHYLLEAVRKSHPTCRVLVISSAQIYGAAEDPLGEDAPLRPSNPYGLSKLAQDQIALRAAVEDQLEVLVARPFNHIGPRQQPAFAISSFARQIALIEEGRADPVLRVGNLSARRDITDVRDVVDAYVHIMEGGVKGRPYNVCSGHALQMRDLLDALLRLASVRIRVEIDPTRLRPHDAPVVLGDGTRIRTELGWAPAIEIEQSLRDTLDTWRDDLRYA